MILQKGIASAFVERLSKAWELRPGSIETHEQEQTLDSYADLVAERKS